MKIRKSEISKAYEHEALQLEEGSLLQFLVDNRYIPRDYDCSCRTAYSGIIFKIAQIDKTKVELTFIYDNLRISCIASENTASIEMSNLRIERSNFIDTKLPLGYKKVLDQVFFLFLNKTTADLAMKEFIKNNFKDKVDDEFYLDSERYAKGEHYVNYAVC